MIASLLPKDINLDVRPLDELSDEQLLVRLRSLTKRAAPLLAKLDGDGHDRPPVTNDFCESVRF